MNRARCLAAASVLFAAAAGTAAATATGHGGGPAPATHAPVLVARGGYRVSLEVRPNRSTVLNTVTVSVTRGGRPLGHVGARLTTTMLDMRMGSLTSPLRQVAPGRFAASDVVLGMIGRWRLRVNLLGTGGSPVAVERVDVVPR